ncbi:acetoacetate--CoA ligase [Streptomyces atroolivaceus]|uniref:Acetoacetate--CoA ligase n=1 Tax=Streptomyces atroolivaceus TaxID=66869 RepID=A0ABV9VD59_STRAZ|nr:acetoacetate--CoA ligase [Streptomyces atroolivaceus]
MSSSTTPVGPGRARDPIWSPRPADVDQSRITQFSEFLSSRTGSTYPDYGDLWRYSVDHIGEFWAAVWDFFDIVSEGERGLSLGASEMPGAEWFPGTRLNYAEHALRHAGAGPAIVAISENGSTETTSWDELRLQVASVARWLRDHGVQQGDRVVGYLPNGQPAVVASLATASLGALWSTCGQDYGAAGAAARFAQLAPVVLFAADGYTWNGETHDRSDETAALRELLPTLEATVHVPVLGTSEVPTDSHQWDTILSEEAPLEFTRVAFDAPLWVLYSSGTTGVPKGIVHGHGGVVLDHHKLLGLHHDLGPGDRFFWYTTTNWMMWNMVVSGLMVGATIVLYDGSPAHPGPQRLWDIAADHDVAVLGVSPGYLLGCAKAGLEPGRDRDLSMLRMLGSTGAPLPEASYLWVRDHVRADVQVASVSGGTDVVSGFAGSAPNTPVWAGELSAPLLGVAMEAWDGRGESVVGEVGELVVTKPMPSMPVFFWSDPDGSRYHDAYFDTFAGVWRHGDWVTVTERGSVTISGRSDATLNRQGVRLGSADIYQVVEDMPEIDDAMVIGAELDDGGYWMPLFVVLAAGAELDDDLRGRINGAIRTQASPRHVPDDIIQVPAIPRTRTGKKVEIPVKRIVQGADLNRIVGSDTVDDVEALRYFARFRDGVSAYT